MQKKTSYFGSHGSNSSNPARAIQSPRDPELSLSVALQLATEGHVRDALWYLERMRYNPDLSPERMENFRDKVMAALPAEKMVGGGAPMDIPETYLKRVSEPKNAERFHAPFRRLGSATESPPKPFPYAMALPKLPGQRNDWGFISDAARAFQHEGGRAIRRICVVLPRPERIAGANRVAGLDNQAGDFEVETVVFSHTEECPEARPYSMRSEEGRAELDALAQRSDLMLFLDCRADLDPAFLLRASYLAKVSDAVVQPLVPTQEMALSTPFAADGKAFKTRYPFREFKGAAFAMTPALWLRLGNFSPRFWGRTFATKELMFRASEAGAYFAPLPVRNLNVVQNVRAKDRERFVETAPNHWDRKADAPPLPQKKSWVPRVSIYIPAYNASRFICRAIESVLTQDFQDLEVCICDDGSTDGTVELLETRYADEPRVRWISRPNGGIGFASNQAIEFSRAPYIGQLDSDDMLKPGAVRRLVEELDTDPMLACVYGSCERVDAEGKLIGPEYSWKTFSRQKMMITSITHHFRMFRRQAWMRTTRFREDITNAVDYDIFLKMSEVGPFKHVDEVLYQRRWHGENTSKLNEGKQTKNTHLVQREALRRLGLSDIWDVHLPDPERPRYVSYRRDPSVPQVVFWPDYTQSNPYQHLLYSGLKKRAEIMAGPISSALRLLKDGADPSRLSFHLHWLNFLLNEVTDPQEAQARVDSFLSEVTQFVELGGHFVWTLHNHLSHDTLFADLERDLSNRLAQLATVLHVHAEAQIDELAAEFDIPRDKVVVHRHGNYEGIYPDVIDRATARSLLGFGAEDEIALFMGQLRPYKGVEDLVAAIRDILARRPHAHLVIAGLSQTGWDPKADMVPSLTEAEAARIHCTHRFMDSSEMQVFLRAADFMVLPYRRVLTSGSMFLALSFGLPVVMPRTPTTMEVLGGTEAGFLYDPEGLDAAVEAAFQRVGDRSITEAGRAAAQIAALHGWDMADFVLPTKTRQAENYDMDPPRRDRHTPPFLAGRRTFGRVMEALLLRK